jgi:heat shock protein HslJ
MNKLIFVLTIFTLAAIWLPHNTQAQEPAPCDVEYTVQSGDWLSKISEKYLGDVLAYPEIVEATNAQIGEQFANIANADLIEPGWLLCIPGVVGKIAPGDEASTGDDQLVGPVWEWQKTLMNDDSTFTPDNSANYTAQFMADGQVAIKADCNQVSGSYTTDGSSISMEMAPSIMAMCPPESLSDQFLAGLSGAAIYFFQEGNLYIDLKFDSGTMRFAPAGAAESTSPSTSAETPDAATEIVVFDPTTIETDPNRAPAQGVCQASPYVPGAYQCSTETGASLDPCFVLFDGSLICNPNPVFGNYSQVVTPTEPLPESSKTGQPVPFSLELAGTNPPCHIRTIGDELVIAGKPVTYGCDAPAAWIIGPLDTSQPTWIGEYVITSPSSGEVTYGPMPVAIARAWVY